MVGAVGILHFQIIYMPHLRRVIGNSESKLNYAAELQFPEEWEGSDQKNLMWEGYGYFLEQHIDPLLKTASPHLLPNNVGLPLSKIILMQTIELHNIELGVTVEEFETE